MDRHWSTACCAIFGLSIECAPAGVESFVRVNLDPEYLEVAVAVLDDEVLDTMEILERTEVRYDDEAVNRLVLEHPVDKHLSRARDVTATG